MSGSPECGSSTEASGGDACPASRGCTARFLLGLQLSGETITDDVLAPLAADGCAIRLYDGAGALIGAELACNDCVMANGLKLDREGGIESVDPVPAAPTMAEACIAMADGETSAGQTVMYRLQCPM